LDEGRRHDLGGEGEDNKKMASAVEGEREKNFGNIRKKGSKVTTNHEKSKREKPFWREGGGFEKNTAIRLTGPREEV